MFQKLLNDDVSKGILAFSPFFLGMTSLSIGVSTGVVVSVLIMLLALTLFCIRNLVPRKQTLVFVLIISVSWVLIIRMFLNAEASSLADNIGLFLPLLLINGLVLSINESSFSIPDFKLVISNNFCAAMLILLFLTLIGFFREMLSNISIFSSSAGCLLLAGFFFAGINFFNIKKKSL